jgi:hypothetical protein
MKKKFLKIASVILFLVLLFFMIGRLYKVVSWKDTSGNYYSSVEQLKNTPDETIDVVFVGTSHVYCGIYPSVMWEEQGISAFNMSVSGQDRYSAYHDVKELLKTQSPKAVFVDLYSLSFSNTDGVEGNYHRNMMCLPTSANSYELLKDNMGTEDAESREKIKEYLLRWPIVHTRYKELGKYDFLDYPENEYLRGEMIYYETTPVDLNDMGKGSDIVGELTKEDTDWLDKMVKLSKENGFRLYFTMLPCSVSEEAQQTLNAAKVYAEEKGIVCLDFTKDNLVDFDGERDFIDVAHLNAVGATKISSYLGEYIKQNESVNDHRGDERYEIWEKDLDYHYRAEFAHRLQTVGTMEEFTDLLSESSDYTVVISREFTYDETRENYLNALGALGMTEEDFTVGGAWVYKDRNLTKVYENAEGEEASYPLGKYDSLTCAFNGDFQPGNILIGNEDYSNRGFYLGVTVYDNRLERVVLFRGF